MQPGGEPNFSPRGTTDPGFSNPMTTPQAQFTRPMPYPQQPPVVPTGIGDIVLTPDQPKSRKAPIIALIVCAVLLVVAGIAFAISQGNQNGLLQYDISLSVNVGETTREAYNKFANYVLNGTESTEEINKEFDVDYNYYFSFYQDDEDAYRVINKLLDSFVLFYEQEVGSDGNEQLNNQINREKALTIFMQNVYTKNRISFEDILNKYITEGKDVALNYANDYYYFNNTENNDYVDQFMEDYGYWASSVVSLIDSYQNAGCLENNSPDEGCLANITDETLKARLSEAQDNLVQAESFLDYYYKLANNYILRVFVINALINNGDISDYITFDESAIIEEGQING